MAANWRNSPLHRKHSYTELPILQLLYGNPQPHLPVTQYSPAINHQQMFNPNTSHQLDMEDPRTTHHHHPSASNIMANQQTHGPMRQIATTLNTSEQWSCKPALVGVASSRVSAQPINALEQV
jgi:hypothetical protein